MYEAFVVPTLKLNHRRTATTRPRCIFLPSGGVGVLVDYVGEVVRPGVGEALGRADLLHHRIPHLRRVGQQVPGRDGEGL